MTRFFLFFLLVPALLRAQENIEVRVAEPVNAGPAPEVRRAEPVAPLGAAAAMPAVDATDGTEAIRAAPSNLTDDPARRAFEQAVAADGISSRRQVCLGRILAARLEGTSQW